MRRQPLLIAVRALELVDVQKMSCKLAMSIALKEIEHSLRDVKKAQEVAFEVQRRLNRIDRVLERAGCPPSELSPYTRNLLRALVFLMKVKGEGVKQAIESGRKVVGWKKLMSLEPFLARAYWEEPPEPTEDEERLSLRYCVPRWLVKYCIKVFGRPFALRLLRSMLWKGRTYVRVNTLKADERRVVKILEERGFKLMKDPDVPHLYRLDEAPRPVVATDLYRMGLIQPGDKASHVAVLLASPEPGEEVLDMCAAPGMKTSYLAQLMGNEGKIVSVDYSFRRILVWRRNVARLGVGIAQPVVGDALNPCLKGEFDLVVLDPPCSGTGSMHRDPARKWQLREADVFKIARVQTKMLKECAKYVKRGGRLLYSTCSITREENELVVRDFLRENPDFSLRRLDFPKAMRGLDGLEECVRLYPHVHETDGFFIALLEKS